MNFLLKCHNGLGKTNTQTKSSSLRTNPVDSHLSHDTFVDVQLPKHLPLQVQSSLLTATTNPNRARVSVSWPPETLIQPEFLAQAILHLKDFPLSASLVFLFWLYNRRLPPPRIDSSQEELGRALQEHFNDVLSESYLLGAALNCAAFQNTALRTVARALDTEEHEAARSPVPHYSSAIPWARKTWEKANRIEAKKLAEFAVDVAARRVFMVGVNGMVLSREERRDLGGETAFAGDVFASVGGQIGVKGVGIRELGRLAEIEEM